MIVDVIKHCFPIAAGAVDARSDEINKLNVFPVPDGDTGTNMSLTLKTVVTEIIKLPPRAHMKDAAEAITHGSLMGARGNSGVITSQILRGLAEGLTSAKHDPITTEELAFAWRNAKKVAYKAVRKPVQGTILTVVSDISEKADELAKKHTELNKALEALVKEGYEAVARTPDLLPVLKENGVVDSGAFGFAIFHEAFVNAYLGNDTTTTIETTVGTSEEAIEKVNAHVHIQVNEDWAGSAYRYCTEFLFKAQNKNFNEKKNLNFLASQGDCELLVGKNPDYKIHVHTNEPDKVLNHMLKQGQIFEVFIHNMDLEAKDRTEAIAADNAARSAGDVSVGVSNTRKAGIQKDSKQASGFASTDQNSNAQGSENRAAKVHEGPRGPRGFVAVCAGSGEAEILQSLGVDIIVQGGQTMNPSTADLVDAINDAHAKEVIVFPNNSNVRMAAEAAANAVKDCKVAVVPTKTVPQAFSAMFVNEPDLPLADLVGAMEIAAGEVRGGEVTTAVRNSKAADGTKIKKGDLIGIEDDEILVVGKNVDAVTVELIERMQAEDEGDTLTLLAGADMPDAHYKKLVAKIEKTFPDLEVDAQRGEQPLYPIIFSIE